MGSSVRFHAEGTGVTSPQIAEIVARAVDLAASMRSGECAGRDFLGWLDLPARRDRLLSEVLPAAESLLSQCEEVVVVGIGGSYLGARALLHALGDQLAGGGIPIRYMGHTLCGDWLAAELSGLSGKRYGVVAISKSGTTLEPAVSLRALLSALTQEGEGARDRVVAITDAHRGALRTLATRRGYRCLVVPEDVGGRYSVLSPVGLLPLALGGVDVPSLMEGAHAAYREMWECDGPARGIALHYASLRHALYGAGMVVEVLATYTPFMQYFGEWYKQLFGESEGKGGHGVFPTSLSYSTDLHSLGQYVQEGRRMLFETHVVFDRPRVALPVSPGEDGLDFLDGKSFGDLNAAVYAGTVSSHVAGGVPCLHFSVPERSAYWMGYLVYVFEVSCALSVLLMGHNPFDQPGVEGYKRDMYRVLRG